MHGSATDSLVKKTTKKKNSNRQWFDWHSWLGTVTGLFLFVIFWSGSFAVFSYELDWLMNPAQHVTPIGEQASFSEIYDHLKNKHPTFKFGSIDKGPYPNFAIQVLGETTDGQSIRLFVDPYKLATTGTVEWLNIQRFFREFHRGFFALPLGDYVVCFFAVPLLASLISGLFFYKRWWKRFLEVKTGKGKKVFWSSLHKTAGLWSLWFVLIIGITGGWYFFEHIRGDTIDGKFAYVDTGASAVNRLPKLIEGPERLPFSTLMEIAAKARPSLEINSVSISRGGYFYIEGQDDNFLVRDRANKMFINPYSGEIVYNQTPDKLSTYWHWTDIADPLHFGDFGGMITKTIWFIFGIILSGLTLSGAWLHLKRLQKDPKNRNYWRGSITAGFIGVFIFLSNVLIELAYYISENAIAASSMLSASAGRSWAFSGSAIFLYSWTIITLIICIVWFYSLLRAVKA
ncbi:MAG: PepSY domain-containing protein [Kordiimonadaceae bacterium]|nr:PepSY domain-containing protein [Kordiimonadaceae bacterium]